jgi:hypothetical protein
VIEAELSVRSAEFRSNQRAVSIEEVQAALPEGATLLEMLRYRPFNPGARVTKGEVVRDAPRYIVYALRRPARPRSSAGGEADAKTDAKTDAIGGGDKTPTPDGDIAWVDLGEAAPIDAAVAALRRDLSRPSRSPSASAAHLFAQVMKPAGALLGGSRAIFLSPDGALTMVPFEALIDEGVYLIDRYAFTYLTSGRDLVRLAS